MTDPTLSQAIKEAYASAPTNSVILHTLEFRHPSFTTPLRVVNDHADLSACLESDAPVNAGQYVTFSRYAFSFSMPEVGVSGLPEITVSIDLVSRDILGYLDSAAQSSENIQLTYRPYLSNDLSAPQMTPPITLTVIGVECDVFQARCKASYGDFVNRRWPFQVYDTDRFPGLVGQST